MNSNHPEEWRPVVGWAGLYEVSDLGRVRSLPKSVAHRLVGNYSVAGRVLKPYPIRTGHLYVNLCHEGKKKHRYVHQLVLEAFVGPRPDGTEACHFPDREPSNNRLENLRWDTPGENQLDKVRHRTHNNTRKTKCPRGHALQGDNLVAAKAKRGVRECRACHLERKSARYHGREFSIELAHDHYRKITHDPKGF